MSKNTCQDSPYDFPDMIENYMDYSSDDCQNMFSEDQAALMRSVLTAFRTGLLEYDEYNPAMLFPFVVHTAQTFVAIIMGSIGLWVLTLSKKKNNVIS